MRTERVCTKLTDMLCNYLAFCLVSQVSLFIAQNHKTNNILYSIQHPLSLDPNLNKETLPSKTL